MAERLSVGFGSVAEELYVPDRGLIFAKTILTKHDLNSKHGVDCRQVVQDKLVKLGLLNGDQSLDFRDLPRIHAYKKEDGTIVESSAQYFFEGMFDDHEVKVSYMPEGRKATQHFHRDPMVEDYFVVGGEGELRLGETGENAVRLNTENRFFRVQPGVEHQLTTVSDSICVLIVMWNAGSVPPEKWHVFK